MNYNQYCPWTKIISLAVKQKGKPAVYISNNLEFETEEEISIWDVVCKKFEYQQNLLSDLIHGGVFFFDTDEEAQEFFEFFNSGILYASEVYAELYTANGECVTENT